MVRRTEAEDPECEGCGYSLLGLEQSTISECPECGRRIDWSREFTGHRRPLRRLAAALLIMFAPQAAIAGLVLYDHSDFGLSLALLGLVLTSPLFAIGGLHMMITILGRTTSGRRAIAGISGLVLGPVLSLATWTVCIAMT